MQQNKIIKIRRINFKYLLKHLCVCAGGGVIVSKWRFLCLPCGFWDQTHIVRVVVNPLRHLISTFFIFLTQKLCYHFLAEKERVSYLQPLQLLKTSHCQQPWEVLQCIERERFTERQLHDIPSTLLSMVEQDLWQ